MLWAKLLRYCCIKQFAREIGGTVLGVNIKSKFAQILKFVHLESYKVIQCRYLDQNRPKSFSILPAYLNYNAWESDFSL